jgi:hypothetical protein
VSVTNVEKSKKIIEVIDFIVFEGREHPTVDVIVANTISILFI